MCDWGKTCTGAAKRPRPRASHLCCRAVGLDTQVYSDAYVLGWANGDMDLVKQCAQSAQSILRVAKAILADLTPAEATAPDDATDIHTTRGERAREALPNRAEDGLGQQPAELVANSAGDEQ
jgi:hypothetical protein